MLRAWLADQSSGCRQLCRTARRPCRSHLPLLSALLGQRCKRCHRRVVAGASNEVRSMTSCRQACKGRHHERRHPHMHGLMGWDQSRRGCCTAAAGSGNDRATTLSEDDLASWGYGKDSSTAEDGSTAEADLLPEPWSDAEDSTEDSPELPSNPDLVGAPPPPEMDAVQVLDPLWHPGKLHHLHVSISACMQSSCLALCAAICCAAHS
jgi:hypothetical protein